MSVWTPMKRVLTTLNHQEPDRVPVFLFPNLHGAKELNLSIENYFIKPENVINGQILLQKKYNHDCYTSFHYASMELEAWGGKTRFVDDGPPNNSEPLLKEISQIDLLQPPNVKKSEVLQRVLTVTAGLKKHAGEEIPIIGDVISPFSLPVMQLGFAAYIELLYEQSPRFWQLMELNSQYCIQWANAQLNAGATAICYFNPLASSSMVPADMYKRTGHKIDSQTLSKIQGTTVTHLASGLAQETLPLLQKTGTAAIGVSAMESLSALKIICQNKIGLFGNLNGIEMCRWDKEQVDDHVRQAINSAGDGGGFILSDNHGEIPWHVSEETLHNIVKSAHHWGQYPLRKGTND